MSGHMLRRSADQLLTVALLFVSGLAVTRLLYEGLFPRFLWLARPLPVLLLSAAAVVAAWPVRRWLRKSGGASTNIGSASAFSPLLLNLAYLLHPAVDVPASRLLFAGSIWLTAVFVVWQSGALRERAWPGILLLWLALLPLYLWAMPSVVGRADTFEFQVVIPRLGIAHPTGYPLYMLLGRLFAALPVGSMAWRINLASAVFAVAAATFLYLAARRLWKVSLAALLASLVFGLTPTLGSQAVEAEVYALNAFIVAAALWLMAVMLDHGSREDCCAASVFAGRFGSWQLAVSLLALMIGLGLANHLTTLILVPAALLATWLAYGRCFRGQPWTATARLLLKAGIAFLLPLLLYAYLPLRWSALHDEPMGWTRFVEWVLGGRFQGALQLTAWLNDATRYQIVARLLLAEWGWFTLLIALVGLIYGLYRYGQAVAVLLLTLAGYLFYALSYYVPDLAVFLIPAHAVIALFWGAGLAAFLHGGMRFLERGAWTIWRQTVGILITLLLIAPALLQALQRWPAASFDDLIALQRWGEGVISLPLAQDAAILADSEKIAPLLYLQQSEGIRPDLEIMVLPDEDAYRAQLEARVMAGQVVYLARFLPGLEGIFHLRSVGPLIEVSPDPLPDLPGGAMERDVCFDGLCLAGYELEKVAAVDPSAAAVTLYWRAEQPLTQTEHVYLRWAAPDGASMPPTAGAHPAGNSYPTVAFQPGEIVSDFHLLSRPLISQAALFELQVAAGPPFAAADSLSWQSVAEVIVEPRSALQRGASYRAQNGRLLLEKAAFPAEVRPGMPLTVTVAGYGPYEEPLELDLLPAAEAVARAPRSQTPALDSLPQQPLAYATTLDTDLPPGLYDLASTDPLRAAICGWLAPPTSGCILGQVAIRGVPLPQGAVNFDDKVALLDVELAQETWPAGGVLPVELTWQGLASMEENYTVFVQVLNEQDQIVGQVDAWPQQGTFPTSQWSPGDIVRDPYQIQLGPDLPPGRYRLQIGLYLLATLRRLPVVDAQGQATDDKVTISLPAVE